MDTTEETRAPSTGDRLELRTCNAWIFFLYWRSITYRVGNGIQKRAMGCLGLSQDLYELLAARESTRALAKRFNKRCRFLIFGAGVPTGLLLNLVVFVLATPALMVYGFLPSNEAFMRVLNSHTEMTGMLAMLFLLAMGVLGLLSRDIYASFTELIDAYNMASNAQQVREEQSTSEQKETPRVESHPPASPVTH